MHRGRLKQLRQALLLMPTRVAGYSRAFEESSAEGARLISRIGSHNVNVDPLPTSLATEISPPSSRAKRREIANPRPVPRLGESVREPGSACSNSSKILL